MSGWLDVALRRAARLGISRAELARRVHGRLDDRGMVQLALAVEERVQAFERAFTAVTPTFEAELGAAVEEGLAA